MILSVKGLFAGSDSSRKNIWGANHLLPFQHTHHIKSIQDERAHCDYLEEYNLLQQFSSYSTFLGLKSQRSASFKTNE